MSTPKNDGGAAFPVAHTVADANDPAFKLGARGMTLRDYFAGQALAGAVSGNMRGTAYEFATTAYDLADAMLAARDRK